MRLPLLHLVVSARPNLPKLAAVWRALHEEGAPPFCTGRILHTGQHHDDALFGQHLADLGLPAPHITLGAAETQGSPARATARIMIACEDAWRAERPDLVVVIGDVDGTLAAALAARKLGLRVAHLEAGLRGGDRAMAEEVNRRAVDAISDILWATTAQDAARLVAEGHPAEAVRAVGNTMADTLLHALPRARQRGLPLGLTRGGYGVLTLHRAENVDDPARLAAWLAVIGEAAQRLPIAWPLHPRTARRMAAGGLVLPPGVQGLPPLGYLDFVALLDGAVLAMTDSGGVQEEATLLDRPCLTLRAVTERPATLATGSSRLLEPAALPGAVAEVLAGGWPRAAPIPLWDAAVGRRIRDHLALLQRPAAP